MIHQVVTFSRRWIRDLGTSFCFSGGCRFKVDARKIRDLSFLEARRVVGVFFLFIYFYFLFFCSLFHFYLDFLVERFGFLLRYFTLPNGVAAILRSSYGYKSQKARTSFVRPRAIRYGIRQSIVPTIAETRKSKDAVPFTVLGNTLYPANVPTIGTQDERITYLRIPH